jgi:hypothetical protein
MNDSSEALAAVDEIIACFGQHRRDAYFAGFAPDATFLFYTHPVRLESRAEYEHLWDSWERDNGFTVLSCTSSNRNIRILGPAPGQTAVFSHDVDTRLTLDGVTETVTERETIVLERRGDTWFGVHEHLSART